MKSVKRQRYNSDFKDRALALVNLGRSVPDVAQELGIGDSILYRWVQAHRQSGQPSSTQLGGEAQRAGGELNEAAELSRLQAENSRLLLENDILKKAAVILGTQPQSKLVR